MRVWVALLLLVSFSSGCIEDIKEDVAYEKLEIEDSLTPEQNPQFSEEKLKTNLIEITEDMTVAQRS